MNYNAYKQVKAKLAGKSMMFLAPLLEHARKQCPKEGEAGQAVLSAVSDALAGAMRNEANKLSTPAIVESIRTTYEANGWVMDDYRSFDAILVRSYLDALEIRFESIRGPINARVEATTVEEMNNTPAAEANRTWFDFVTGLALDADKEAKR